MNFRDTQASPDASPYGTYPNTDGQIEPLLDGPDFKTVEWEDETSQYDQNPTTHWHGGTEAYFAWARCRVPAHLETEEAVQDWIDQNLDRVKWIEYTVGEWERIYRERE